MSKSNNRFTVDEQGRVIDRESSPAGRLAELERGAALYRKAKFEREAAFKRQLSEMEKRRYQLAREQEQAFLKQEEYRQSKYGAKSGAALVAFGLISFGKASNSSGEGWWLWGIAGIVLIVIGALLLLVDLPTRLGGPQG